MVTTRRCSVMTLTVLVLGTSTSMPDCRMGAVIMKMMRSTKTTSMNGTMLISESDVCVPLEICGIDFFAAGGKPPASAKSFLDLRSDFESKGVEALPEFANVSQELVVKDDRGNGGKQTGGGGNQRFGNAGSHGAQTGGAGGAEAGKGVNDAPNSSEETDKRTDRAGGGQPLHAFFDATDFVGGSLLHGGGDGRKAFQFGRSEEHTSELQSRRDLVCRLLLEKKKKK